MKSAEVYRTVSRRIRRGSYVAPILWYCSSAATCVAFFMGLAWGLVGLVVSINLGFLVNHVRLRNKLAWIVSERPDLVYWAHPTNRHERYSDDALQACSSLMLHLRNGWHFEVDLDSSDMVAFVAWLIAVNPSVRIGPYD